MTEEKKTVKKATSPKATKSETGTVKKAPAKKAAAPKASQAAAPAPKSGKTLVVKQVGSPAGSEAWAYQTLKGLGLGKMNRVRTLEDTPAVRGMINRVHHLVDVQSAA